MSEFEYKGPDGSPVDKEDYKKWANIYNFPQIFNESKTAGAVFIEDSEELKESEDGFFYPDYQHNNATDMTKEEFFNYEKNQEKSKEIIEKFATEKNKEYFKEHGYTSIDNYFKDNLHNEFTLTDEKVESHQYADNEVLNMVQEDEFGDAVDNKNFKTFDSDYVKDLDDKNQNKSYYDDFYDEREKAHSRKLPVCGNVLYMPNAKDIGDYAFAGQGHIAEVYIADNNGAKIGKYAFAECDRLTRIHLSEQLKELPEGVFENDVSLDRLKLPQELEKIGNYAFHGCKGLNFIHIPYNVKEIGDCAFMNCNEIVDISFLYCKNLEKIGNYAFSGCPAVIKVPDSVREVGKGAFSRTDGIIISKDTLRNINIEDAFSDFCYQEDNQKEYINALKEVVAHETPDLTNTGMITNNCIMCDNYGMYFNKPYEQIQIDDFEQFKAFMLNTDEKELEKYSNEINTVLDKEMSIDYAYAAPNYDSHYKNLTDLSMKEIKELMKDSNSIKDFSRAAERYMRKENDFIKLAEKNDIDRENRKLNANEEMVDIVVPEGTEEIGTEYMLNEKIRSITLPENIRSIKYNAFVGCVNLEKVNGLEPMIVKNVQNGRDGHLLLTAFDYTKVRNEISDQIDKEKNFEEHSTYIGKYCHSEEFSGFYQGDILSKDRNNVVLSENTEKIGDAVFYYNKHDFNAVVIAENSSLTEIGRASFEGSLIKNMGKRNELEDGVIKIPGGVKHVGEAAFRACENIRRVEIPESVNYLNKTFADCKNLEEVSIPNDLLAKIDIDGVFSGTKLNLEAMKHRQEEIIAEREAAKQKNHAKKAEAEESVGV